MDEILKINDIDATKPPEPEIPGILKKPTDNKIWDMRFRIFNLEDPQDIEDIQELYTKAANSKGAKKGTMIFSQIGRFLDDGSYRMMVYWGDWKNEKTSVSA